VSIGNGCIVNANAVVAKNVPAGCIIAGVPARVIKRWSEGAEEWQQA
jgi:acetyltransferase-like isoleucine patch superfamily enzyme